MKKALAYIGFPLFALGTGFLSSFLSQDGIESMQPILDQIPLNPPNIVFPIVWSLLYILMGISAARIFLKQNSFRSTAAVLWITQLAVNFGWSILFFRIQLYFVSFLWLILLWLLVGAFILAARPICKAAAYLQIPYLLWLTFAGFLNFSAWQISQTETIKAAFLV